MVQVLILLLFLFTGIASGWIGFDLLPPSFLEQLTAFKEPRLFTTCAAGFIGLLIGYDIGF